MDDQLIQYPFKIDREEDAILYRIDEDFEMRFTQELTSKRVSSSQKKSTRKYLELEIDDNNNIRIVKIYDKIHVFNQPADFYLPISEDSKFFYESLHSALIDGNLDNLSEKAKEIDKKVQKDGFPEFPLPLLTVSTHFENFEMATAKTDEAFFIPSIQIKFGDEIPQSTPNSTIETAENYLTLAQFKVQNDLYESFFESNKIARFKTIADYYETQDIQVKRIISLNIFKKCIPLHAYFMNSGPWRKCWVKMGYNPTSNKENYKFQVIEMRLKKISFQIFQKPEIIYEVSQNADWYLTEDCDPVDGFISKALKNFIIYIIDNGEAKLIDSKIENLEGSDFEIFDM